MRSGRNRAAALALAASCLFLVAAAPASRTGPSAVPAPPSASKAPTASGNVELPPPTSLGSFEGTWYYVDPDFQIAIFVSHDKTGLLRLRYQVESKSGTAYETDDGGCAKYIDDAGNLVEVLFTGTPSGQDKVAGLHQRIVHTKTAIIEET